MEQLGGYATLGQLYKQALEVPGATWGTQTPFASMRRIVQQKSEYFFKIRPGLWGLTTRKDDILRQLNLGEHATLEQKRDFDHYYYQGLLVETGKLKAYPSYVPPQDRGKPFLGGSLGDTISLENLPPFTYERLVRRASTIDVIWMNERGFPLAFFEVEHSTDIQNSLLKFVEFQDFYVRFYIVAAGARETELKSKLTQTAFQPIKDRVQFLSYDKASNLYEKELEVAQIREETGL
ncbi:MAG: hypothetical protein KIT45_08330 [Fimbriimonadia bacterium]|nr:hypothetical protein [Fimbriimonadia bacterium]